MRLNSEIQFFRVLEVGDMSRDDEREFALQIKEGGNVSTVDRADAGDPVEEGVGEEEP